uniref:Glycogen synthase kinase 3 n=1 Tax=Schmidtea mediterranea TaxID=79327 RepID=Q1WBW2_SCHMD|nr:glycogen synthase kinase 3 [Schmidtea mediterranea]
MGDKITRVDSKECPSIVHRNVSDLNQLKTENNIDMPCTIQDSVFDNLPVTIVVTDNLEDRTLSIQFIEFKEFASGSFGTVYDGLIENDIRVAVKKVLQDRKYKNRELEIMRMLNHNNITNLLYFFFTISSNGSDIFLNLVMEYIPQTISRILKFYSKNKSFLPMNYAKLYWYQILRGIHYMHQQGICHRDIKPQNLLVNPSKALLRICDFGSAKPLVSTETNVAYICSRYYRAPELIFGSTHYTVLIDIWSVGCVFSEILINKPIFPGETSVDQLVEIIKVLGSPSVEQIADMNENYKSYNLPVINPCPLNQLFLNPEIPTEMFDLLKMMFDYSPKNRITAIQSLIHPCFDVFRKKDFKLDNGRSFPPLLDFSPIELKNLDKAIINKLIP